VNTIKSSSLSIKIPTQCNPSKYLIDTYYTSASKIVIVHYIYNIIRAILFLLPYILETYNILIHIRSVITVISYKFVIGRSYSG